MEHISIETTMDIYAQVTDKKNGIKEEEWVQSGECRSWERCFKHAQGVGLMECLQQNCNELWNHT